MRSPSCFLPTLVLKRLSEEWSARQAGFPCLKDAAHCHLLGSRLSVRQVGLYMGAWWMAALEEPPRWMILTAHRPLSFNVSIVLACVYCLSPHL